MSNAAFTLDDEANRRLTAEGRPVRAHAFKRHPNDWYQEPLWCSQRLFQVESFHGVIYDPACGEGRILKSACEFFPLKAVQGADIVDRGINTHLPHLRFHVRNFLSNEVDPSCVASTVNIVSNPPYQVSDDFLEKALKLPNWQKIAFLMPTTWASPQKRAHVLQTTPLRREWKLTPRPSMPPGGDKPQGFKDRGGHVDYSWFIWERGYSGAPEIRWLHRIAEKEKGFL